MRPTKVTMLRTINTGNYENVRLAVEVEIDPGESATEAMAAARRFLDREARRHHPDAAGELERWQAQRLQNMQIVRTSEDQPPRLVKQAQRWLDANPEPPDDPSTDQPIL